MLGERDSAAHPSSRALVTLALIQRGNKIKSDLYYYMAPGNFCSSDWVHGQNIFWNMVALTYFVFLSIAWHLSKIRIDGSWSFNVEGIMHLPRLYWRCNSACGNFVYIFIFFLAYLRCELKSESWGLCGLFNDLISWCFPKACEFHSCVRLLHWKQTPFGGKKKHLSWLRGCQFFFCLLRFGLSPPLRLIVSWFHLPAFSLLRKLKHY